MMLSDVCLSVAYIGPKSRTERPMETEIGPAHVTSDLDTTFKVKRSKVRVKGAMAYCGGLPPTACSFCQSYTPVYNT